MSLPLNCHDELFNDIENAILNELWVPAPEGHWLSQHEHQRLTGSWSSFVEIVKHRTRYHFHLLTQHEDAEPGEVGPGDILSVISGCISQLTLFTQLSPGHLMYRVRLRNANDSWEPNAAELGAPPNSKARAGRMNPAGISYLYLALDTSTALAETITTPPVTAVVATFAATRPLSVIDLTALPEPPSVFDFERADMRESLLFLEGFIESISQPTTKNHLEHVEYIPSQVVCEYLAQVFQSPPSFAKLDGLLYRSAVRPGGINLVIFPNVRSAEASFSSVAFQSSEIRELMDWSDVTAALSSAP
jgi:hypothetical protein